MILGKANSIIWEKKKSCELSHRVVAHELKEKWTL